MDAADQGRLAPTPVNIMALPEPLRAIWKRDPAGDVRELFRLQTENRMLRWEAETVRYHAGWRQQS